MIDCNVLQTWHSVFETFDVYHVFNLHRRTALLYLMYPFLFLNMVVVTAFTEGIMGCIIFYKHTKFIETNLVSNFIMQCAGKSPSWTLFLLICRMSTFSFFVASLLAPIINYVYSNCREKRDKDFTVKKIFCLYNDCKHIVYMMQSTY